MSATLSLISPRGDSCLDIFLDLGGGSTSVRVDVVAAFYFGFLLGDLLTTTLIISVVLGESIVTRCFDNPQECFSVLMYVFRAIVLEFLLLATLTDF